MHYTVAMASRPLSAGTLLSILVFGLLFPQSLLGTKKKPPERPVNLNTATSEQLQQVPGIGPATAGKILQMRKTYGPFKSVDDLLAIRGLGAKRLGARPKIDFLKIDPSREAPIWGYPVQCASANYGTAPMIGILRSILFPRSSFFSLSSSLYS